MKKFNKINKLFQWSISMAFGVILVLILNWWIDRINDSIIWILLIFIIVPVIQFLITPLFALLKFYTYYSPMVVSFGNSKRMIDLHNGTSFDYLLEMNNIRPGKEWERKMLTFYLEAFLNIANQVDEGKLPNSVIIRGSSYFISDRSAERLGLKTYKTSYLERVNILLNYFDLTWMYSLSKGKIAFPNLFNIKTIRITGADLVKSKQKLSSLLKRLNKNGMK